MDLTQVPKGPKKDATKIGEGPKRPRVKTLHDFLTDDEAKMSRLVLLKEFSKKDIKWRLEMQFVQENLTADMSCMSKENIARMQKLKTAIDAEELK